jgi:hypothetical protein
MPTYGQAFSSLGDFIAQLILRNKERSRQQEVTDIFNFDTSQNSVRTIPNTATSTQVPSAPMTVGGRTWQDPPRTMQSPDTQVMERTNIPTTSPQFSQAALRALTSGLDPNILAATIKLMQGGESQLHEVDNSLVPVRRTKTGFEADKPIYTAQPNSGTSGYSHTDLYKHQAELDALKTANPNDPRVKVWEDKIDNIRYGLDTRTWVKTDQGLMPLPTKGRGGNMPTGVQDGGIRQPLPPAELKELSKLKTSYKKISELEEVAKANPNVFGAVSGRWNDVRNKFVADGATQEVINRTKGLVTELYRISGKQLSDAEREAVTQAILPSLNQPFENFLVTLGLLKEQIVSEHDNSLNTFSSGGYGIGELTKLGENAGVDKNAILEEIRKIREELNRK